MEVTMPKHVWTFEVTPPLDGRIGNVYFTCATCGASAALDDHELTDEGCSGVDPVNEYAKQAAERV